MLAMVIVLIAAPKPWVAPPPDSIGDYVRIYEWWAALINLVPLGLLAVTAPLWLRGLPPHYPEREAPAVPRGFWPAVGAAMVVCAALGAVRMNDSLWHDEEFSVRRAIVGTTKILPDGTARLKALPWTNTFWYYDKPTNHILQSILSRVSNAAWRIFGAGRGREFSEIALRLPAYLAGILSVGALALLLARTGMPWTGAVAAWLLALHPWHLKLAPEVRGYAFIFLLLPLLCLCLTRALDTGRWRWWVGLGAAEFLLLYTWPPAIFIAGFVNLCAVSIIFFDSRFLWTRSVLAWRWLVSGLVAGVVFLQLMLPCVPQFLAYTGGSQGFRLHGQWFQNVGALLLAGELWSKSGRTADSPHWEMLPQATAHPLLTSLAALLAVVMLVMGAIHLWRQKNHGRWLVVVFLLPGLTVFAFAVAQGQYLFEWYLSFLLPGFAALVAAGILKTGWAVRRRSNFARAPLVCALVALLGFVLLTWQSRAFLLSRPAQSYRESVLLTRPVLDPNAPENHGILTASSMLTPVIYDPRVRKAHSLDDYAVLMHEAEDKSQPFFINNGFPDILKDMNPEIDALLSDPQVFTLVARLPAVEPLLDRVVYRYVPGGVLRADFESYKKLVRPAPASPDGD